MNPMEARIQSLEAQVNAMAQAWLYLAANVEVQCGIDMEEKEGITGTPIYHRIQIIDLNGNCVRFVKKHIHIGRVKSRTVTRSTRRFWDHDGALVNGRWLFIRPIL
ncbi:hypothetical protein LH462_07790 [Laribacter hongkongensis]|uniref:Uncharacterized protein n=1 Tax=Laribacter hongkongensis TaxID=168471 RepID=A0ABD4SUB2_9NEIS|nr:hypothetical protein [Laribacter hongkongensis]MCG9027208.1 hypothetical protein [Laribacter hongkongensis]MCG9101791.1 hypothetical protein [Laribacter hongkongensis]MCG9103623.1 hypothetical protein [Laribacter hongkongensis]MCG9114090.1 hypothetical protein [Laribacter hongkongensis]MCG9117020.1 hypothetical protein [Laribacter hongkongensis]